MVWIAQQLLTAAEKMVGTESCVTSEMLANATGLSLRQVSAGCVTLIRRELMERIEPGCYFVTEAGKMAIAEGGRVASGQTTSRERTVTGGLRARAWRAIRIRKKFSVAELVRITAEGTENDAEENLRKYVRALRQAGYLAPMARKEPGMVPQSNGFTRYLLVRDTGPQAPVWRQSRNAVFDPNTGEESPCNG